MLSLDCCGRNVVSRVMGSSLWLAQLDNIHCTSGRKAWETLSKFYMELRESFYWMLWQDFFEHYSGILTLKIVDLDSNSLCFVVASSASNHSLNIQWFGVHMGSEPSGESCLERIDLQISNCFHLHSIVQTLYTTELELLCM